MTRLKDCHFGFAPFFVILRMHAILRHQKMFALHKKVYVQACPTGSTHSKIKIVCTLPLSELPSVRDFSKKALLSCTFPAEVLPFQFLKNVAKNSSLKKLRLKYINYLVRGKGKPMLARKQEQHWTSRTIYDEVLGAIFRLEVHLELLEIFIYNSKIF